MRLAIISDIHGNLEALRAVLADLGGQAVDQVGCLGDSIGYGPEPEAVVDILRRRGIPSVMGNHELGLADPSSLAWFNPSARQSLLRTAELLSPETMEYNKGLPRSLVLGGCRLVHGCPPESVTRYLFELSRAALISAMNAVDEPICFVGHTHTLALVSLRDKRLDIRDLGRERVVLGREARHLVNAGSVGQPRDGDNNAKYVIWDDQERLLEVRFVPYDIAATVRGILERGLPEFNAERLW